MFIRRIRTRTYNGTNYHRFRLVESKRFGDKVRQQHRRVSAQYDIEDIADANGKNAIKVKWNFNGCRVHRDATAGNVFTPNLALPVE